MKKALSIALILLLLLNVMGYYAVLLCLEWQHERQAELRLDLDDFKESQAVTIKFPLTIPYVPDAQTFERVQGIFQHNGTFYRLVKQKYAADTLTIVCIRDKETERLQHTLDRYVSTLTDNNPEQKGESKPIVSFIKDYIMTSIVVSKHATGWQADLENLIKDANLTAPFLTPISHPPEVAQRVFRIVWAPEYRNIKKVQVPFGLGFLHLFYLPSFSWQLKQLFVHPPRK